MIKDFLYLDFERIRSYTAQLDKGVTDTLQNISQVDANVHSKLGVKALLEANIGTEVLFSRSDSETKSIHHYLYNIFESIIKDNDMYSEYDSNYNLAKPFVLFKGEMQIIDYTFLTNKLFQSKDLLKKFSEIEKSNILINKALNQVEKTTKISELDIKYSFPKGAEKIVELVQNIFGNSLKVNIIKNNKVISKSLLSRDKIELNDSGFFFDADIYLDEEWTILGQTIKRSKNRGQVQGQNSVIDDSLMQIYTTFSEMSNSLSTTEGIEVVPIAIYKEIK